MAPLRRSHPSRWPTRRPSPAGRLQARVLVVTIGDVGTWRVVRGSDAVKVIRQVLARVLLTGTALCAAVFRSLGAHGRRGCCRTSWHPGLSARRRSCRKGGRRWLASVPVPPRVIAPRADTGAVTSSRPRPLWSSCSRPSWSAVPGVPRTPKRRGTRLDVAGTLADGHGRNAAQAHRPGLESLGGNPPQGCDA